MRHSVRRVSYVFLMLAVAAGFLFVVPSGTDAQLQVNFDTLKKTTLAVIDAAIVKLNAAEAKIGANPNISPNTKADSLALLNVVENTLISYKGQVEQATTLAELKAINQEMLAYLVANKDVFKEAFQKVIANIAENSKIKAEEFKQKVEQLIAILKITCPSEKATIETLERQLVDLETNINQLSAAIKAGDTAGMKKEMKEIQVLMQAVLVNIEKIEASCL